MTFPCPDDATLQRLHEGALDEGEEGAIRAHLEGCAPCRARSARIALLFATLATPPALPQPPADFLARVMANAEAEGLVRAPERRLRATLSALAAGGAAIAGGAGLAVAGGGGAGGFVTGIATGLTDVAAYGGLAGTVLSAAAPVLTAGAVATLAILTPIFLKTLHTLQPRPATVRVSVR